MLIIKIIVGVVIVGAILGFLFSSDGEKEEGAKTGAISGLLLLGNLTPLIIVIAIAVFIIKSCL